MRQLIIPALALPMTLALSAPGRPGPAPLGVTANGPAALHERDMPATAGTAWVDCAREGQICRGQGWGEIRYGIGDHWHALTIDGNAECSNAVFRDPAPATAKRCQRRLTAAPLLPADVAPIDSNFARAPLIGPGAKNPVPSAKPDVVGAFRFICTAGQLNYDDPILYPGRRGGSPHLHQWYGNTGGGYASTYRSLRSAGESTCSNRLNRSAYWVPALMTAAGRVIQPDYMSIYYKRLPDGDPMCQKYADKGCVGLPTGLRAVSGYDMGRMGDKQPENITFSHRCISPGKPSEHRATLTDAVADCGGSGQIMSAIEFGDCWNGMLDSADHRSHLVAGAYIGQSYPQCPHSHPFLIPTLRQQIAYSIRPEDGAVWFSSDRMHGRTMPSGSTFHADYMEAWDPQTRATWERLCIGRMLNCSDGALGDGTMMKRGPLGYLAAQRIVAPPARIL